MLTDGLEWCGLLVDYCDVFLSAVWTLILTAPIHVYISPNLFPWRYKLIYILDGLRVSTFPDSNTKSENQTIDYIWEKWIHVLDLRCIFNLLSYWKHTRILAIVQLCEQIFVVLLLCCGLILVLNFCFPSTLLQKMWKSYFSLSELKFPNPQHTFPLTEIYCDFFSFHSFHCVSNLECIVPVRGMQSLSRLLDAVFISLSNRP